jgi:hypothetical protein
MKIVYWRKKWGKVEAGLWTMIKKKIKNRIKKYRKMRLLKKFNGNYKNNSNYYNNKYNNNIKSRIKIKITFRLKKLLPGKEKVLWLNHKESPEILYWSQPLYLLKNYKEIVEEAHHLKMKCIKNWKTKWKKLI